MCPFYITGIGGIDFTIPIIGKTQHFDLTAKIFNIRFRGFFRVCAGIDGKLFSGETKSIPAHGMQDIKPFHTLVASDDIRRYISQWVANMESCP